MSAPSVTWTFTNGTTSDATQVNTNFTDIINCMTDGAKDFAIGTLTVAGAASFSGNVTLGNASADDITFAGSLAGSVPIKANATYNIGAAATGLLSLYLGNGTKTIRLIAPTITNTYTLTFPVDVPSLTGKVMVFDTNATASFRYPDKFTASKTSAYTATGDETIILCDATSASFTVTLPAASTMTGKQLKIIKTDSDFTKLVTIDPNASETINGAATYILNTQNESVVIACDGTNWFVIDRYIPSVWTTYAPTFVGYGTPTTTAFVWRRTGDTLEVCGYHTNGTNTGVTVSATLPTGLSIDATKFSRATTTANPGQSIGTWVINSVQGTGHIVANTGTSATLVYFGGLQGGSVMQTPQVGTTWSNTVAMTFAFRVPIVGWAA